MKLRMKKQILAVTLCVAMFCGDILPTTASVSSGDAADYTNVEVNTVSDNELTASENTPEVPTDGMTVSDGDLADVVLTKEVSGVTITLTAPAGAVPEGTELWAEEIKQSAQLDNINQALEAEEEKKDVEVQNYKAFDIKLLANDVEVQPTEGVKVTFAGDMLLPANEDESVAVYHVTEDAVANEMAAVVTENAVEMETTHFSVYVIVVENSDLTRTVTYNHYLGTPESRTRIYAPSTTTVEGGQILKSELPIQGLGSYKLTQIAVTANGNATPYVNDVASDKEVEIKLDAANNVIDLYYEEISKTYSNGTTLFDYYVDDYLVEHKMVKQDTIFKSFVYKGVTYTNYGLRDAEKGILQEWKAATWYPIESPAHYEGKEIQLALNETIANVVTEGKTYSELEFVDGGLTGPELAVTTHRSFNGGINAGADLNQPFLAMGRSNNAGSPNKTEGQGYDATGHVNFTITKDNGAKLNFNTNNTTEAIYAIKPGLVERLDDPNGDKSYTELVMGKADNGQQIQEPGYFTKESSDNKAIYTNYSLNFKQTGSTYELDYVQNDVTEKKTFSYNDKALNRGFFPLDDVTPIGGRTGFQPSGWESGTHNLYFGMRYDFNFNVGDYVGQMDYEFIGDDDLWVFVDGKLALDLGGMHAAYPYNYHWNHEVPEGAEPNTVDLWNFLYGFTTEDQRLTLTEAQKKEVHTVTILYMERGGSESSCAMKFVMPNVAEKPPVITEDPQGSAEFVKVDENGNALEGATFGLYKEGQEEPVRKATSGEDGKVKFVGVEPGDYYVKEITAPDGYQLNNNKYNVTIVADQTVQVNNGKIENKPVPNGAAEFTKVASNGNKALEGAVFGLYKEGQEEPVKRATSAKDGLVRFTDIKPGSYYIKEIQAPDGYVLNPNKFYITVVSGETVQVNDGRITNQKNYGEFTLKKADKFTKDPIEGAKFELLTENGNSVVGEAVSDAGGNIHFVHIPMNETSNTYLVREIVAKDGYQLPTDTWKIKLTKNGDTFTIQVQDGAEGSYEYTTDGKTPILLNEKKPISVKVVKKWEDSDGNADADPEATQVQVKLYREHAGANDRELVETFNLTKDNKWTATMSNLDAANEKGEWYYFVEEGTVAGYVLKGEIEKNVLIDPTTKDTTIAFTLTNKPNVGDLKITKKIDKVNTVYGAATFTFKIENGDGYVLYRTITFDQQTALKQEITIENIPVGNYTVTELDNIRYTQKQVSVTVDGVETVGVSKAKVTLDSTPIFNFVNEQTPDKYYSHSDVVVNSFRQNGDGSIGVSKNRKVLEKKEFVVE